MSKPPDDSNRASTEKSRESQSDSLYLIMSMADTTWRMFVPTIGLTLVGVYLDTKWDTMPWLTLVGAAVGGFIAAFFVKKQLQKVNQK